MKGKGKGGTKGEKGKSKGKGNGEKGKGGKGVKGKGQSGGDGKGQGKGGGGKPTGWNYYPTGFGYQGTCWKCGQVGHKANECPLAISEVEDWEGSEEEEKVEIGGVWSICAVEKLKEVKIENRFAAFQCEEEEKVEEPPGLEKWREHWPYGHAGLAIEQPLGCTAAVGTLKPQG